ncbi:MAG: hypothetical protein KC994_16965 [Candidatus Omnitrophica bacterium]|nr:hypothetical protein [Candidatus Omnitrophota bacterium]
MKSGIGREGHLSFLRNWVSPGLIVGLLVLFSGCDSAMQKVRGVGSSKDPELEVAALAGNENRNQVGLYLLNYTNIPGSEKFTGIQIASGRLLSSNDGRFLFTQTSSEPGKNYSIYFNPEGDLLVVFPNLKQVYRAPAGVIQSPDAIQLLAGYDGMRLLMSQGNVWSDPSRSQFTVGRSGATVEQPGRPYKWDVEFESGDFLFPIKEMEARSGFREIVKVARATLSYESLDYSSGGEGYPGNDVRGSQINVNTWTFKFAGTSSTTEIQINPLGEQEARAYVEKGRLDPPNLPDDYKMREITLVDLMNWLNIRP